MASSSSQALETIRGLGTIRQINNAVYEFHRPAEGSIVLDIVFFHGFQAQGSKDAYWRTWMLADGSACWLNTLLAEEHPQSRIMSVAYDSSTEVTDSDGRMDMYVVGENLAQSVIDLAGVGQTCPVVLVGHGVGGLVLKEVCYRAEQLGNRLKAEGAGINSYETFLRRMKGAFFFSTPHLGTPVQANLKRRSPLLKYYELLSADSARLISSFQNLRKPYRYGWKTCGSIEANITENRETSVQTAMIRRFGWEPQSSPVVVEGSGRIDMDEFYVLNGKDSFTICKPEDRSSSNFQILLKFVQRLLEDEEWALKNWASTLALPRVFIRMPYRVQHVVHTLRLGEAEPSKVSLVGMGGIGKSTLAKELLLEIRSQFDFVCYVDDVKDRLKRHALHTLVADNLYYGSGTKVRIQDVDEQSLWRVLKGKKVLLIMDNVDSEEQISTLLMPGWVQEGSRLIVTSRQRTEQLMPTFVVHEVPVLSHVESKNLFLAHVDMGIVQQIPKEIFDQVVAKCDGLPLTLEVIGSYLGCKKDLSIWKEATERLRKAESINGDADDRLWAKLRVSFDRLGPPELRMFLDLAVFDRCEPDSLGYDLDICRAVWGTGINRSIVNSGLTNLVDKCFIRIRSLNNHPRENEDQYLSLSSDAKFVHIHEQLRDMGKSIVRPYDEKIELCRGVWQSEDVDEMLAKIKGEDTRTEMLSVAANHALTPRLGKQYRWSSIGHLRQLRLLRMSKVGMTGDGSQRFPPDLAFFHMNTCCRVRAKRPFHLLENDYWPIRAEDVGVLHKLTVLIVENCSSVRLPGNFDNFHNLRLLIIRGTELTKLPKKFGHLPSIQVLVLERVGLVKLPDSFLQLSSLETLTLRGCPGLKALPGLPVPNSHLLAQGVRSLQSMLKRLMLEDLPALRELPETFGLLGSLEEVLIKKCSALVRLPESFGRCHQLKDVQITQCASFKSLGESFWKLRNLQRLCMDRCEKLQSLPEFLGQTDSLKSLIIRCSTSLKRLPESVGLLRNLEELHLGGCENLQSLPECLGQIDTMNSLYIVKCTSLKRLPESVGLLRNLANLDLGGCENLQSLPECLGQLHSLKILNIRECSSLEQLPESTGLLRNLQQLYMQECENLQSLPECFGQLDSLNHLDMSKCESLSRLPESVGVLRNLRFLDMKGCENLQSLPECLGQLHSLLTLNISNCSSLERLPESIGLLRNFEHLYMEGCENLQSLPEG